VSSHGSRSGRPQGPRGTKRPKGPGKGRQTVLDLCRERFVGLESERLYAAILCGDIYVNGVRERNPKQIVQSNAKITLESVEAPSCFNQVEGGAPKHGHYVSRGGEKLEAALAKFALDPTDCCVLDAGASTGGFTDCLLRHGAECVHAVDVGYNQLAYELRNDARVRVQERVNIKSVTHLVPQPDFAVADLSFRSLCGVAGHLLSLTTRGVLIALLKPQFERQSHVAQIVQNQSDGQMIPASGEFDGVVTDSNEILRIAVGTVAALESEQAYTCGVCLSPIKGRSGNQELFLLLNSTPATRLPSVEADLRTLFGL
jgi:23S rRNA (cytidine1920-2'-O)/16S rRNA (cytidine1409-2'-O)-methyltransferase